MRVRPAWIAVAVIALLVASGAVEYHGTWDGLALLGLFGLGAVVGFRTGRVLRGTVRAALAGLALAAALAVLAAVGIAVLVVVTAPLHDGWGFLSFGLGPALLASPPGLVVAGVVAGGVALVAGAGGFAGGVAARTGTVIGSLRGR
jgi:hypothetical protein